MALLQGAIATESVYIHKCGTEQLSLYVHACGACGLFGVAKLIFIIMNFLKKLLCISSPPFLSCAPPSG